MASNNTNELQSTCEIIVQYARNIGLHVTSDSRTPGDGNCWYHSIIQQLNNRPEIHRQATHNNQLYDHHHILRLAVVDLIKRSQNETEFIKQYRAFHVNVFGGSWNDLLKDQERNSVYASERFIYGTAVLLGDELVTNSTYSCQHMAT